MIRIGDPLRSWDTPRAAVSDLCREPQGPGAESRPGPEEPPNRVLAGRKAVMNRETEVLRKAQSMAPLIRSIAREVLDRSSEIRRLEEELGRLLASPGEPVHEIREVETGRLVVTGEVMGAFTSESGRPVRIPAAFVERLAPITIADAAGPKSRSEAGHGGADESRRA